MGKAVDKLRQLRNDLVGAKKQMDGATEGAKAELLKTLKSNGIKAESVIEYTFGGAHPAGVFVMGGKKYACEVDPEGVTYAELADQS